MKSVAYDAPDCEGSKLEREFAETVHDPSLAPLLQVTRGLMRFLPSSRMTADEALGLLKPYDTFD